MRFISASKLKEGMLVGKNIYNNSGNLLLSKGSYIKDVYIQRILEIGIQGVYIEDNISKDIKIDNIISDELRIEAVNKTRNMFIDVDNKTFDPIKGTKNIESIVENMVEELIENKDLMVNMIDIKTFDDYTYYHSVNVSILAIIVGLSLDLNRKELLDLGLAALMHDIGKIFIDKDIINKPSGLTDEEFEIIKEHPLEGYRYLKYQLNMPVRANVGVLQHHEKFDGSGYPYGRAGDKISLFGRIIAIADVYDALTTIRPYSKPLLPSEAMEYIMGSSDSHFDYELVNLFITKVAAYPVGTCVKLSNGLIGIVVENFPDASTRPKIKIIDKSLKEVQYINLKDNFENNNITITEIVYI